MERIHGTCVAVDGAGVLLRGPSGSGKSDLALRLIDGGGCLVADDYTDIAETGGRLFAKAPPELKGLLEVRGIGIVRVQSVHSVPLVASIDLMPCASVERMPPREHIEISGVLVPCFRLCAIEPSSVAKVALAVRIARATIMLLP
jgi:HPr kinase/phosphorylase